MVALLRCRCGQLLGGLPDRRLDRGNVGWLLDGNWWRCRGGVVVTQGEVADAGDREPGDDSADGDDEALTGAAATELDRFGLRRLLGQGHLWLPGVGRAHCGPIRA